MKKYNGVNSKFVLIGIILPMLAFLICLNAVFAYFTATTNPIQGSNSTAILLVGFSDDTTVNEIDSTDVEGNLDDLLPGDSLTIDGKVVNSGNTPLYFILHLTVTITPVGSITETVVNKNYTIVNNEVVELNSTNTAACELTNTNDYKSFTLIHTFPTTYGNTYQNATVNYNVTAYAIQTATIASATAAAEILVAGI